MIALDLPTSLLWTLRWFLFLGPLAAFGVLARPVRHDRRRLVACLFAFLYGLGLIFATHVLASAVGWWRYGGDVLMLQGIPADIWLGGALLFGPVLYLAFPKTGPLWIILPIIVCLHGLFFASLPPLVYPGPCWFVGVVFVFAVAHVPSLYLARWTAEDRRLPERATLLAIGYGFLAFGVLPCLILQATGGTWNLQTRPIWLVALCVTLLAPLFVLGLTAVQLFVVYGGGTPIPLDPTKRLVRAGVFAYVSNPMQLSSAASWVVIGIALGSAWIAAAALMAWVFVFGMVRWHHRHDLMLRFPEGWPKYRAHVPEWIPLWRPWFAVTARLTIDPSRISHRRLRDWMLKAGAVGLTVEDAPGASLKYTDGHIHLEGRLAALKALEHVNLACAMVSATSLLVALPLAELLRRNRAWLRRIGLFRHA